MPPTKKVNTQKDVPKRNLRSVGKAVLKTPSILKIKIPKRSTQEIIITEEKDNFDNKDVSQQNSPLKLISPQQPNKVSKLKKGEIKTKKKCNINNAKKKVKPQPNKNSNLPVKKRGCPKPLIQTHNGEVTFGVNKDVVNQSEITFDGPGITKNFIKVWRANEVAKHQLQKKTNRIEEIPDIIDFVNNKRTRKRKVNNENVTLPRSRRVRKIPIKYSLSEVETKSKRTIPKTEISRDITITKKNVKKPLKRSAKLRANNKNSEAEPQLQNVIINTHESTNNNEKSQKNATQTVKNTECVDMTSKPLINRPGSSASSEKSWTRDISSSEASFVAVLSNDFFLIDKKMPVLKLSNIDTNTDNGNINNSVQSKEYKGDLDIDNSVACSNLDPIVSNGDSNKRNSYACSKLDTQVKNNSLYKKTDVMSSSSSSSSTTSSTTSASLSNSSSSSLTNSPCGYTKTIGSSENSIVNKEQSENITKKICLPPNVLSLPSSVEHYTEKIITDVTDNVFDLKAKLLSELDVHVKMFNCDTINVFKPTRNDKNIDASMSNKVKVIQDKIFTGDYLKEEKDLIRLCQCVKLLLHDFQNPIHMFNTSNDKEFKEDEVSYKRPYSCTRQGQNKIKETKNKTDISIDKELNNIKTSITEAITDNNRTNGSLDNNTQQSNKLNCSFQDNDDDDALSLFAESITGIEPFRRNSAFNSKFVKSKPEAYIPQPLFPHKVETSATASYHPTKISQSKMKNLNENYTSKCEKQKADSTSLVIESGKKDIFLESSYYEDRGYFPEQPSAVSNTIGKNVLFSHPRLMATIYEVRNIKSTIFNGLCLYNLGSSCKRYTCAYHHVSVSKAEVKTSLSLLSEELFIKEYMHLRKWPKVMRKYGACFVEECIKRELPRILVEMALDFIVTVKTNCLEDKIFLEEMVDNTLIYLNEVDLSSYDDLLRCDIRSMKIRSMLLCEYFISVIASSQNFTRFKSVFINLTKFIHHIGRRFCVNAAESILERVSILPYDEMLARALMLIMKNTDVTIFSSAKITDFARQLRTSNVNLYDEFNIMKEQGLASQPVLANAYLKSAICEQNFERVTDARHLDKNTRSSPDSTDLGNMNKTNVETTFTRTIDLNNIKKFNINHLNANNNNKLPFKKGQSNFKKWNNRFLDNMRYKTSANLLSKYPQRPGFKRNSDESFYGGPAKFPRKNGPNK